MFLVQQGVPQTMDGKETAALLDAQPGTPPADAKPDTVVPPVTEQPIAVGPVASQVAIKQLGTNGGGYYNVNSAHPLENPTPLSNFVEDLAILLISAGAVLHVRPHGRIAQARRRAPDLDGPPRRAVPDR